MAPIISTAKFLDVVLPEGIRYIGFTNGKLNKAGRPIINCTSFEKGASGEVIGKNRAKGQDVYFALASFKVAKVYDEKNGYMKSYRHQENVAAVKSLWLDVDFKSYDSPEEAVRDIKRGLDEARINDPTFVVHSGGGLHLYWVFEEAITKEVWERLAHGLAGLTKRVNIRADLGVTIDSARVLRLPGTRNQKYDDKPECRILKMGNYASIDRMRELLERYSYQADGQLNKSYQVPDNVVQLYDPAMNQDLTGNYDGARESFAKQIFEKCPTMKAALDTQGANDSYPMWKDVLHLLAFTEDGKDYIHEVSKGYDGYSEDETQMRFEESLDIKAKGARGPTTCARFDAHGNSKCKECKFRNVVKTPWSLGVTFDKQSEVPTYVIGEKTFRKNITRNEDGEIEVEEVKVCDYACEGWDIIPGKKEDGESLQVLVRSGKFKETVSIPRVTFHDSRQLMKLLLVHGVAMQDRDFKRFREAGLAWLKHLLENNDYRTVTAFGWTPEKDGFVLGNELVTKEGISEVAVDKVVGEEYQPKGDPEPWKKLAKLMCQHERPEYSFIIAAGFTAPIMRFGTSVSLAISVFSRQSGVGKSTALRTVQAAFGHPRSMFSLDDTENYITKRAGILQDMPMLWDEIRGAEVAKQMTQALFRMTQGKTKGRLNASADMRDTHELHTMLLCATNTPIADYVRERVKDSDAGSMRFIEFELDYTPEDHKSEVWDLTGEIEQNYGHAGRDYLRYLIQKQDKLAPAMAQLRQQIETRLQFTAAERFWKEALTKTVLTAGLLRSSGVIPEMDPKRVLEFGIELVKRQRVAVEEAKEEDTDLVSAILSHHATHLLITNRFRSPGRSDAINIRRAPATGREVKLHAGIQEQKLFVTNGALRDFVHDLGLSYTNTRKAMIKKFGAKEGRHPVGGGTSLSTGQHRGLWLDISEMPELTSFASLDGDTASSSSQTPTPDS